MLIHALCEYYDLLSASGKVLPEGYSNVKIHYLIALTEEGKIEDLIDWRKTEWVQAGKKQKEKKVPQDLILPQRTEKPGIEANIAEHRPLYLFGLNQEDGMLTPVDKTDKAKKSHQAFVEANLKFTEGMQSAVVCAYRKFLETWKPEEETENIFLKGLGKELGKSGFAFCLSGRPDCLLHEEKEFKAKWEKRQKSSDDTGKISQCAVTGEEEPIARIHSKIKGVAGGLATGSVLIGFNNPSENSYGNEQSYNSNISETAMKKYTEAFNYLLGDSRHKILLDDMTIVFWAMNQKEECEDLFMSLLLGSSERQTAEQTEEILRDILKDAKQGKLQTERLQNLEPEADFYLVGIKPNSSRLSVKFVIRKRYADLLWNMARFQQDLQISTEEKLVSYFQIKRELISPKSKNEKVNPALMSKLLESVMYGKELPVSLLETVVRRVKTDSGAEKLNRVRAGLIKACINRMDTKEELKVALDRENENQAYLCGRLFAVLEKLQQDASGNSLNRTIKDAYFSSASSKPVLVFPKLIRLAQNHLNKVKYPVYYQKLLGEIMTPLQGEFPEQLSLKEQGKFIVGYYQQYQNFFKPSQTENE